MFIHYDGIAVALKRALKERGLKLHSVEDALLESAAGLLQMTSGEVTQDHRAVIEEMVHYCLSHHVVCVSAALAEQLSCTEMDVELDHLKLPFHIFEVCIDDKFKIHGDHPAPGVLACIRPSGGTADAITSYAVKSFELLGLPVPPEIVAAYRTKLENSLYMRWKTPLDGGICHIGIKYDDAIGKPIDTVVDELGVLASSIVGMVELDPAEKAIEKKLLRIVLGALCYLNTSDPEVEKFKDRNRPSIGSVPPDIVLLGRTVKREVAFHLRKAHWRHLVHQRFQRDEDGKIKVVWVRPAVINPGAQAKEAPAKVDYVPKENQDNEGSLHPAAEDQDRHVR